MIVGTALALVLAAWGLTFLLGARATAVLAVLGYRLVSYWLPLPAGAVACLRIKLSQSGREPDGLRAGSGRARPRLARSHRSPRRGQESEYRESKGSPR